MTQVKSVKTYALEDELALLASPTPSPYTSTPPQKKKKERKKHLVDNLLVIGPIWLDFKW